MNPDQMVDVPVQDASCFQSPQPGPETTWSAAAPLEHKDTPEIRKGQVGMHWGHAIAADADGLELHYVRWGQGTPQVLLLHGWPGFWYDWRRVLPRLAQFTSVIAPDLRGFGSSAKPDWPVHAAYSPEAQACEGRDSEA